MKHLSKFLLTSFILTWNLVLLSKSSVNAQTVSPDTKIYMAMPDLGPSVTAFMQQNDITPIPVFYSKEVDPDGSMKVNSESFTNFVNKKIPDASASGYAAIDWEGKILTSLIFSPQNSTDYQNALGEYMKVLQLARQLRPNMKWGLFPIPYPPPVNKKDLGKVNSVIPLLKLCDVFYPQLYLPYNKNNSAGMRSQSEKNQWISYNLSSILATAKDLDKPVLPFIWHRFYDGGSGFTENSLKLIPLNEFNDFIKDVLACDYQGKKVSGLVWWGNDTYFYNVKSKYNNNHIRKGYRPL